MTIKTITAPARWRRTKLALAIIAAIVASPAVIVMLIASLLSNRR